MGPSQFRGVSVPPRPPLGTTQIGPESLRVPPVPPVLPSKRDYGLLIVPSVSPNRPPLPLPFLVAINAVPSISTNILLPSMPGLVVIFRTDVATIYLALSLYLVGLAIGQLAYGPLSDRFG